MLGMEVTNERIENYLTDIFSQEDPVLIEMESRACKLDFPIVGPLVGRLLHQLVLLTRARRILELGSGFGYSGYWLGSALGKPDEIHLTEFSKENLELAKGYFSQGKICCHPYFHQGDGVEILEKLEGQFDIIFNDVDKDKYPEIFPKAMSRLRHGGILVSDNVLWHGRVVDANPDETTLSVLEHNRLIFDNPDFFSSIIPIRDGIAISLKR